MRANEQRGDDVSCAQGERKRERGRGDARKQHKELRRRECGERRMSDLQRALERLLRK